MLIIKNNINSKKLKEFGFEPRYSETTGKIVKYIYGDDDKNRIVYIDTDHNYLPYWELKLNSNDLLYDLIKADLVEKV